MSISIKNSLKLFLKLAGIFFICFVLYLLIIVDLKIPNRFAEWVEYLPFKDKMGHFLLIGTLAFFTNILFDLKRVSFLNKKILLGSLIITVFITIEEFSQIFLSNRNFDLIDLVCNYAGILVFGFLSVILGNYLNKNNVNLEN